MFSLDSTRYPNVDQSFCHHSGEYRSVPVNDFNNLHMAQHKDVNIKKSTNTYQFRREKSFDLSLLLSGQRNTDHKPDDELKTTTKTANSNSSTRQKLSGKHSQNNCSQHDKINIDLKTELFEATRRRSMNICKSEAHKGIANFERIDHNNNSDNVYFDDVSKTI